MGRRGQLGKERSRGAEEKENFTLDEESDTLGLFDLLDERELFFPKSVLVHESGVTEN